MPHTIFAPNSSGFNARLRLMNSISFLILTSTNSCLLLLCCFLVSTQYRPIIWRNTHPYVIVDRHEDITHPSVLDEDANADRTITMYGYVRGTHLKPGHKVHMIGMGDFDVRELNAVDDPCMLARKDEKRTTLNKKKPLLCAPCVPMWELGPLIRMRCILILEI